ncbi:MAG: 23S rRNA (uracil(1939)-C(5))-methyltransferase RlmD [Bacillota bacterium]
MERGKIVELTIEDISAEGQGIGRIDGIGENAGQTSGMVVFVSGALPGDTARVELIKVKKNYALGRAVELLHESEYRRADEWCPYQDQCGGCPYGRLEYAKQLELKEQQVRSRLERIGGLKPNMEPIVGMDETEDIAAGERYRDKAVMKISTGGLMTRKGGVQEPVHEPRIGFYQAKSHDVVDCLNCRLQVGTAMAAAEATRQFMTEDHICSYDERWDKGLMKQMSVKTAFGTGEVMVIYDINGKGIPNAAKLVEYLDDAVYEAGGSLESVVIRNDKKTEVIAGKNTITDVVTIEEAHPVVADAETSIELQFEISANSFYQVNHDQMEKLYAIVRRYCKEAWGDRDNGNGADGPVVLDLYCGIGTIGLCVADMASHVHGIEIVKDAVTDANRNAVINGIVNATYTCGKAEELLPQWEAEGRDEAKADIAILDPPRAGCKPELLRAIADAAIPSIIYVSCDPATLARDVKLLHEEGYELISAAPVDMFPNAGHVECVVLMTKK